MPQVKTTIEQFFRRPLSEQEWESDIKTIGLDSLMFWEMIGHLEKTYQIELEMDQIIDNASSLAKISGIFAEAVGEA